MVYNEPVCMTLFWKLLDEFAWWLKEEYDIKEKPSFPATTKYDERISRFLGADLLDRFSQVFSRILKILGSTIRAYKKFKYHGKINWNIDREP